MIKPVPLETERVRIALQVFREKETAQQDFVQGLKAESKLCLVSISYNPVINI